MASAHVTGTIRDAASSLPVAGAEVRAAAEAGSAVGEPATARSDVHGAFALAVTWAGEGEATLHLEARGATHAAQSWPVTEDSAQTSRLTSGSAVVTDLALRAGFTLELEVVDDDGRPIEGAVVDVIENNTVASCCSWPLAHHWLPRAHWLPRTDAAGHAEVPGLGELEFGWRHFVSVRSPDRAEGMLDRPEQLRREGGVARARVVLARGHTVEGVLRGGRPAEGEILTSLLDDVIPGCHSVTERASIDGAGRFRITGLHAGTHRLNASAPGAASVQRTFRVPLAGPLEIELPEGRHARGTVVGADGEPLADAQVTAEWPGPYGHRQATTDARGSFSLDGLPADQRVAVAACRTEPTYGEAIGFAVLEPAGGDVDLRFDARARVAWSGGLHDDRTGAAVDGDVLIRATLLLPMGLCPKPRGRRFASRGAAPAATGASPSTSRRATTRSPSRAWGCSTRPLRGSSPR